MMVGLDHDLRTREPYETNYEHCRACRCKRNTESLGGGQATQARGPTPSEMGRGALVNGSQPFTANAECLRRLGLCVQPRTWCTRTRSSYT
jgi:hypothetical protein